MNVSKMTVGGPGELHVNTVPEPMRRRRRRTKPVEKSVGPGNVYQPGGKKPARDNKGRFASTGSKAKAAGAKIVGSPDADARRAAANRAENHRKARKRLAHRVALFGGMAAAAEAVSNNRISRHGDIDDENGTLEFRYGLGERNRGIRTMWREPGYHGKTYGRTPIVNGKRWHVEMDNRDGISRGIYVAIPQPQDWFRGRKGKQQGVNKMSPHASVLSDIQRSGFAGQEPVTKNDLLRDIAKRLDTAADVAVELSDISKHPGHSDQSAHASRYGVDRGRSTVGRKPAQRGRRNRQGHDPMGRYTSRSRKRDRRRALWAAGAATATALAVGGGMKYHDQGVQLIQARRDAARYKRDAANRDKNSNPKH